MIEKQIEITASDGDAISRAGLPVTGMSSWCDKQFCRNSSLVPLRSKRERTCKLLKMKGLSRTTATIVAAECPWRLLHRFAGQPASGPGHPAAPFTNQAQVERAFQKLVSFLAAALARV